MRSAASRAYYSGFHVVLSATRTKSGNSTYLASHRDMLEWLEHSRDPLLEEVGQVMKEARKLRSKSDYRLSESVSKLQAGEMLKDTRDQIVRRAAEIERAVVKNSKPLPPSGWEA
jgi:uncharacterized protein (UPF0332 family)